MKLLSTIIVYAHSLFEFSVKNVYLLNVEKFLIILCLIYEKNVSYRLNYSDPFNKDYFAGIKFV